MPQQFGFGDFTLDRARHELRRGERTIRLKPRYFDVLALLVERRGDLVAKEEFFETLWSGSIVGDEALTQAIKEVRRALGDSPAEPRYIETVPRRGYRFIAEVHGSDRPAGDSGDVLFPRRRAMVAAGTVGGALAGLAGGTVYGLVAGTGQPQGHVILLVMASLSTAIGALGAFGLGAGMALASRLGGRGWRFSIIGAALGGFVVGAAFHLVASGGFSLLTGVAHRQFAGGLEGALLGAAVAAGARAGGGIAARRNRLVLGAALGGAAGGVAIALLGGRLMAASLAALARRFHGAALDLGRFGGLAGDGEASALPVLVAGAEGLLLGAAVAAALAWRWRRGR